MGCEGEVNTQHPENAVATGDWRLLQKGTIRSMVCTDGRTDGIEVCGSDLLFFDVVQVLWKGKEPWAQPDEVTKLSGRDERRQSRSCLPFPKGEVCIAWPRLLQEERVGTEYLVPAQGCPRRR